MKISSVLRQPKFLVFFLLLSVLFAVAYLIVTGTYVISLGAFIETIDPLRLFLILVISLLTALAITLMLYKQSQPLICSQNFPAFLGSFIGLFTTSCPVCFPLILTAAGISGSIALTVSQNAVPIQIASVALLVASIWLTARN